MAFITRLRSAGFVFNEITDGFLHTKMMIIDHCVVFTGSANFTFKAIFDEFIVIVTEYHRVKKALCFISLLMVIYYGQAII